MPYRRRGLLINGGKENRGEKKVGEIEKEGK